MNLLAVHDLSHDYGEYTVFRGLNFTLSAGDRLAIIGASGAGKSTLLRLLAGLETPRHGRIERAPGLRVGMVFQDLALWPNLTALENAAITLRSLGRRKSEAALIALKKCRVEEFANRLPSTLSIGQQQRAALARAIATEPQLLLLDEPFSSLDLILKQELFATIGEIARDRALVLVTHDPFEALALCDTALVLESSVAIEHGPIRDLLSAPKSQLLQMFSRHLAGTWSSR